MPTVVAALALVLSGCFRSEIGIDVHDAKSVDITILMAFDTESMSGFMPEGTGDDLFDQLDETPPFPVDTEQEVEIEPYDEDGYQGAKYTVKDVPLDEVQDLLGSDTFELEWGPDGGRFEATASMEGLPGVGDLTESLPGLGDLGGELGGELPPDAPEGLGNLDDLGAQMDQFLTQGMQDMSVSFSVTMPGPVEENNGTEVRGNTVVWKFSGDQLQSTEASVMSATWGPAGSSIPWMWMAIGGAALLLVVLVIVLVTRRKRPEPALGGEYPGGHGAGPPAHGQVQYPAQYP
ncbi:MAG: hypothetical protein DYH08_09890, partial [Actinobacteria bacterium ATB1]|nr:hypothetical protein [Actinobacteria bacterium ATB1]